MGPPHGLELSIIFGMSLGQKATAFTGKSSLTSRLRLAYEGAPQSATHPKSGSRSAFDRRRPLNES
jgi:hypothetical protein